jgi:hypothetical protein
MDAFYDGSGTFVVVGLGVFLLQRALTASEASDSE